MSATVRPCDGRVVVKLVRPSAVSPNGIHMPENLDRNPTFGRIVAVGNGRQFVTNDGKIVREEVAFKVGEVVKVTDALPCFPEGRAGPEFYVLNIDQIPCVVDGFVAHDEPEVKLAEAIERMNGHVPKADLVVPKKKLSLG